VVDGVQDAVDIAGDADPGPPEQFPRPCVAGDHRVGQDHRAAMLDRHPGLDARPALLARLDHHGRQAVAGHRGVPHRERVLAGRRVRPELRKHHAAAGYLILKRAVFRRVGAADPGSDHGDRAPARVKRGAVRGGVNATRESRDHCQPPGHERPRDVGRHRGAARGSRPGADDAHAGVVGQDGAQREDHRGRLVDAAQPLRVARVEDGDEPVPPRGPGLNVAGGGIR